MNEQMCLIHTQKGMFGEIDIFKRTEDSNDYIFYKSGMGYYHSDICINNPLIGQAPLSMVVLGKVFPIKKVLILGAGLFANSIQMSILNSEAEITAVDIEACLYDLGKQFLDIDKYKNIKFVGLDARKFIEENTEKYDYIIVDIFKNSDIPVYFLTDTFYELINRSLNEQGILVINSNMPELKFLPQDEKIINPVRILQSTLFHSGFKTIYGNDTFNLGILYAFKEKHVKPLKEVLTEYYRNNVVDVNIKAAIAGLIVKMYQVDEKESFLKPYDADNKERYHKVFQNFLIQQVMKDEMRELGNINGIYDEIGYITYKYFLKEMKKMKGGYNIGDVNYYNEILKKIKTMTGTDNKEYKFDSQELMRYINFGLELDSILLEDLEEVPYWANFLAVNRLRKNKAKEAESYFNII